MKLEDLVGPTHVDIAPEMTNNLPELPTPAGSLDLGGLLARIYADAGLLLQPSQAALAGQVDFAMLIARIHSDAQELLVRYQGDVIAERRYEDFALRRRRLALAK